MTPPLAGLTFHHFGLAVKEPEHALRFLHSLGYESEPWVHDELQRVNLTMCRSDAMPSVEVICGTGEPGPLDSILKRVDAQLYHVCYETDDLESVLKEFNAQGHILRCVVSRKPAILFGGRCVSFYYLPAFGLIEILERGAVE